MAALLWVLVAMLLFLVVWTIAMLCSAQVMQTRLFSFGWRSEQDAPETLPG